MRLHEYENAEQIIEMIEQLKQDPDIADFGIDFVETIAVNYEKYGDRMFLSQKQLEYLEMLSERGFLNDRG